MYKVIYLLSSFLYLNFSEGSSTKYSMDEAITKLSAQDKIIVEQMQQQIMSWTESVFKEVKSYRDFIVRSRKQAEEMQKSLSSEAQEALKIEEEFKTKLSPEGIKLLEGAAQES